MQWHHAPVDEDEQRYAALGRLVEAASSLEAGLRSTFCALVGSKYATIAAAGRSVDDLIETCSALTKANREISEPGRDEILSALRRAKPANARRNRLVHDVWVFGHPDGAPRLMKSTRGDHTLPITSTSVAEVEQLSQTLLGIEFDLHDALVREVGPERATIESQLRWEESQSGSLPVSSVRNMAS
jgi:hypothetical protein